MTEIFNLHTLCRCCHSDGSFKSLQLSYAHDNRIEVYSTMLKETFDLTIRPPPVDASYAICDYCIYKLREAAHFKQQVLDCEIKFEEYCKNEQSLIVKEEVNYESNDDYDSGGPNQHINVHENEGKQCGKFEDQKCDIKINEINCTILHDGVDIKYDVKVKEEKVEDAPRKSIKKTTPTKCETDTSKALDADGILQKHGLKGSGRKGRGKASVDAELESHVKTEDGDRFICKLCDKKYVMLQALRRHIQKDHEGAYKCHNCSLQFSVRVDYLRHKKTHGNTTFKCEFCEKSFRQKHTLLDHLNVHTKSFDYQCDICHKKFNYKQSLKKHILWHYNPTRKCICYICGNGFNDNTNLNIHIKVVHEKQRPFQCSLCPRTFTANKHLKEHTYYHTGERPYKCDPCNVAFMSSSRLRYHQDRYHCNRKIGSTNVGQAKKVYTCKVCKKELDNRARFMAHVRRHVGEKQYKCHLCVKDFTCKYSLNRHIAGHSGLRPFSCDLCDKSYTQKALLRRHKLNIHDPNSLLYPGRVVERVKCDLCNKSFKNIKKHMVSHKSRPHVCEFCQKSYPERNTLNRHILIVHQGYRRHPCTLCDKKFTRFSALQKHTKKIHKLELKREVETS